MREFVDALMPTPAETELAELVAGGRRERRSARRSSSTRATSRRSSRWPSCWSIAMPRDEALAAAGAHPRDGRDPTGRRAGPHARVATVEDAHGELDALLERVKDDDAARQEFLDLLELLGPDDPRTASYRKALTTRLF